MVTVIQERHMMLDMEIGDCDSNTRTKYNAIYADRWW